jgi:hypothetical protein
MAWIEFYLIGAGLGFLVAILLIIRAVEEYYSSADWVRKKTRTSMIWSIVGASLLLPFTGVIFAGLLYMVLR